MGGDQMVGSLIEAGLIDELRLITYPVIAGRPHALFGSEEMRRMAELVSVRDQPGGLAMSSYLILSGQLTKGDAIAADWAFTGIPSSACPVRILATGSFQSANLRFQPLPQGPVSPNARCGSRSCQDAFRATTSS
jgi:hypothetical protein